MLSPGITHDSDVRAFRLQWHDTSTGDCERDRVKIQGQSFTGQRGLAVRRAIRGDHVLLREGRRQEEECDGCHDGQAMAEKIFDRLSFRMRGCDENSEPTYKELGSHSNKILQNVNPSRQNQNPTTWAGLLIPLENFCSSIYKLRFESVLLVLSYATLPTKNVNNAKQMITVIMTLRYWPSKPPTDRCLNSIHEYAQTSTRP